jgi:hypothetical protein
VIAVECFRKVPINEAGMSVFVARRDAIASKIQKWNSDVTFKVHARVRDTSNGCHNAIELVFLLPFMDVLCLFYTCLVL